MRVAAAVGLRWRPTAAAHPAPFSFLDLRLEAGRVTGTLTVHDLDAAHELGLAGCRGAARSRRGEPYAPALADLLAAACGCSSTASPSP